MSQNGITNDITKVEAWLPLPSGLVQQFVGRYCVVEYATSRKAAGALRRIGGEGQRVGNAVTWRVYDGPRLEEGEELRNARLRWAIWWAHNQ